MPIITLPDGSQHRFNRAVSTLEVAQSVSPRLAEITLSGLIDGHHHDSRDLIERDVSLEIVTQEDEIVGLEIVRHSCIHLLGRAIKQLYPSAQMVTGSIIESGFYYDIDINHSLSQGDMNDIEEKMRKLVEDKYEVIKKEVGWQEARDIFKSRGETYKVNTLEENMSGSRSCTTLCYHQEYVDTCCGPLAPNINFCRHFKLLSVAGAYLDGKKENKVLQRVYGTVFHDEKALRKHLAALEEAENRDHRKIGRKLDLFHMQPEAPGMIFWHHNGWKVVRSLESFIREKLDLYGYEEVKSPMMMDRSLWEKSGHWEKYPESMFVTSSENRSYAIKPMNCPGHVQIFNQSLKSYRDLPLRMAEFGSCHRNEFSGALHGIMRVRNFTQDDAHIFCTQDQVQEEVTSCIQMVFDIYQTFGFENISVKLSTRPEKRVGSDTTWSHSERALEIALQKMDIEYEIQEGEGAFYGPKIEFTLHDCLDRPWQCGTIQLDFNLPSLLGATYTSESNEKLVPVMIHRVVLGSLERFVGILTEHYSGLFPTWLAPVQAIVLNITSKQASYAQEVTQKLKKGGISTKVDLRNEKIGFKIHDHTQKRIPYMLICGYREMEACRVSVRTCQGKDLGEFELDDIISHLQDEVFNRKIRLEE